MATRKLLRGWCPQAPQVATPLKYNVKASQLSRENKKNSQNIGHIVLETVR